MILETITSWALIAFGLGAVLHFWWESIIAPSLRMEQRLKLFALRDDLRREMIEAEETSAHLVLQENLNSAICIMRDVNFFSLERFWRFSKNDVQLKREIENRERLFAVASPKIQAIRKQAARIVLVSAFINFGGWFLYILPFILALAWARKIERTVSRLLVVPVSQLSRIKDIMYLEFAK